MLEAFTVPPSNSVSQMHLPCLGVYRYCNWPIGLFVSSLGSLTDLALGYERLVARDYAHDKVWSIERLSNLKLQLSETIAVEFDYARIQEDPIVHLTHLALTGLDLLSVIRGGLRVVVDLCSLETLNLYSCGGLGEAFGLIMTTEDHSRDAQGIIGAFKNLRHLHIRCESSTIQFQRQLGTFLALLPPLVSLQVLLEGCPEPQSLKSVWKSHGRTLRSLVWDQRSKRRSKIEECTSVVMFPLGKIYYAIMDDCPGLVSLGISLNWQDFINGSDIWRLQVHLENVSLMPHADVA